MRSRARRILHAIIIVIGVAAFALLVRQLGWEGLRAAIVGTGWWFLVIAALDLCCLLCDAGASYSFVRPHAS